MKHLDRKAILFVSVALGLFLGACNGAETNGTATGSTSLTTTVGNVTISQLSGDSTMVHIPKEVFGNSETDIATSTVEIWMGSVRIEVKDGETLNYSSGTGSVWFSVSSLQDGDDVSFVVRSENGATQTFSGSVSDTSEVTASLNGESPVQEEESEGLTATFGKLSNNKSLIIIPLEALGGSSDDLEGATIDVSLNSELIAEGLEAPTYYSATYGAIRFYLDQLEDGDALRFKLYSADGSTVTFYGNVSAEADTEVTES